MIKELTIESKHLLADWEVRTLGEVCEIIKRGSQPKYTDSEDGEIVLNQKCIRDHKINLSLARKHDKSKKTILSERYIQLGDGLINSTGTGTLGRVAQVRKLNFRAFVDTHITIVRPKKGLFFLDFFGWALIYIEELIKKSGEGASGQTELSRKVVEKFIISYPTDIGKQKQIVATLDKAFASIEKAKANTEQNLQNAKELFDSYLQEVFENKEGDWKKRTLKEVCIINPKKSEIKDLPDDYLVSFLPMKDLGIAQNQINPIVTKKLSEVKGSYTYFKDDDVLLAKVTPCFENGKLGIARKLVNGIGFGSSEYIVFRTKGEIHPDYLFLILSSNKFRNRGKELMFGAVGLKRLSKDYVENFLMFLPTLDEQTKIIKKVYKLSNSVKTLKGIYTQKIADLEEGKKSILQKAFSGELNTLN